MTEDPEGMPRRSSTSRNVDEPPAVTGKQRAVSAALNPPRRLNRKLLIGVIVCIAVAMVAVPAVLSRIGIGAISTDTETTASSTATAVEDYLHVSGRVGATPVVSLTQSLPVSEELSSDVVVEGDGDAIELDSPVLLSISTFSGEDGANTTAAESGTSLFLGTLNADELGEALTNSLTGVAQGSRVVLRAPISDDIGNVSMEITVVDVLYTQANGESQDALADSPTVKVAEDGTVSVSTEGLDQPNSSSAEVLVRGTGEQITGDCILVARSAMFSWGSDKQITSSWGDEVLPGTIDMSDTLTGIQQYLVDIPVGSRVVLSLTADQARGDEPVVVVIDILAISGSGDSQ